MKKKENYAVVILCPLIAALIWGIAFIFQAQNGIGTFTFNFYRNVVATLALFLFLLVMNRGKVKACFTEETKEETKKLYFGGALAGFFLCFGQFTQQYGIDMGIDVGKASFLTALYVVLVPVLSIFILRKKTGIFIWGAVLLSMTGIYFLSVKSGFSLEVKDLFILCSAVCYACQIISVSKFVENLNPFRFSMIQFLTVAVISLFGSLFFESFSFEKLPAVLPSILYLGILSSGVAFTLQSVSEKAGHPALVTVFLSLESVFGAIGGAVFLHEKRTPRELFGAALIFIAVLFASLMSARKIEKK